MALTAIFAEGCVRVTDTHAISKLFEMGYGKGSHH